MRNVSSYAKIAKFPLKYKKSITPLPPRSLEVEKAIKRIHEIQSSISGSFLEYLLRASILRFKYSNFKEEEMVGITKEFENEIDNFFGEIGIDKILLISKTFCGDFDFSDNESIAYALLRTIKHLASYLEYDPTKAIEIARSPDLPIILNWLSTTVTPYLVEDAKIVDFPSYLTNFKGMKLRSSPDLVVDSKIIDVKVSSSITWSYWARQLYLYRLGIGGNYSCFILNLLKNEFVEFTFDDVDPASPK